MSRVLRTDVLERLRLIADSVAAAEFAKLSKEDTDAIRDAAKRGGVLAVATSGCKGMARSLETLGAEAVGPTGTDIEPDGDRLRVAQRLFARYANEISAALLLAALPQTYASEQGSEVLFAGQLSNSKDLKHRIRGTAQFLTVITQPSNTPAQAAELWNPSCNLPSAPQVAVPPPWRMCAALRLYHEVVRHRMARSANARGWGAVLNQEDLLGTVLTFTITVFEVLERFGLSWTADEQDAYLHLWDLVGAHLGIGTRAVFDELNKDGSLAPPWRGGDGWVGLRPDSVAATRALLEEIRAREWVSRQPGAVAEEHWQGGGDGRQLVRALLDELNLAMPPRFKSWPLAVMRQLAPAVVQDRLQLGAPGFVMGVLGGLPKLHSTVGRFTGQPVPNPLDAITTRMMANEVARRATVNFIKDGPFLIPGLEAWSAGFQEIRG